MSVHSSWPARAHTLAGVWAAFPTCMNVLDMDSQDEWAPPSHLTFFQEELGIHFLETSSQPEFLSLPKG